jgi:gluconokinase
MQGLRVIVMGVSGCGKSTVAAGVAQALGLTLIDGDDLHLAQSVAKMRAGVALDDADRWPWLDRIGQSLLPPPGGDPDHRGCVIACSALKRVYRDRLREAAAPIHFIFLDGDVTLIAERMARRTGHYMQPELLASQVRTLERPGADETDVVRLDISQAVPALVSQAVAALNAVKALTASAALQAAAN